MPYFPAWPGASRRGTRFIILVDNSIHPFNCDAEIRNYRILFPVATCRTDGLDSEQSGAARRSLLFNRSNAEQRLVTAAILKNACAHLARRWS